MDAPWSKTHVVDEDKDRRLAAVQAQILGV
jgi:hypothetical protein